MHYLFSFYLNANKTFNFTEKYAAASVVCATKFVHQQTKYDLPVSIPPQ